MSPMKGAIMFFAVHGVTAAPKKAPPSSGIESPVKVLLVDGKSKTLIEHTVISTLSAYPIVVQHARLCKLVY
jgi:hypothetical protein